MGDVIDVKAAARLLGVTPGRVRQYIEGGALPAERLGDRAWMLKRADVEVFKRPPMGRPPNKEDADGA
jgi:excisionase family DNA binding protein